MERLREVGRVLRHPYDTFEDLKYKKTGSVWLALLISVLWFIASTLQQQYTSPWFNALDTSQTNIPLVFVATVGMFLFFTIANWSICTLFNGEGTYREIVVVTGYALLPYVLSMYVTTLCSYVFSLEEAVFLQFLTMAGLLYSLLLLVLGMMQIHQYSLPRVLIVLIVSVIGVFLLLFLCFLMIMLVREIISFFQTLLNELLMRSLV